MVEAHETGLVAEALEAEEQTMGKTSADLATAVEGASDDTRWEMWGAIAGNACIEIPAKIAGSLDNDRVAATVATEWTGKVELAPPRQ